jgi:thiol-disulfide isomerase/thioredoxin
MHREFADPRGKLARKLQYEYDVVYVEAAMNKGNKELAATYGADLQKNGYPFLTILDASGKPLANQETDSLEVKGDDGKSLMGEAAAHDQAKVLAFLTEHQAPYQQADAVIKDAMDQAKASGKKVFLHVGAPWCIWCHRLEDWLAQDDVGSTFAKDYVDLKVDQDRMVGAKEAAARFGMPEKTGIPWFVIIDPQSGKAVVDSMGPDGTIGCPANDQEIQQFMGMLEKTHKNLTAADMESLKKTLLVNAKKYAGH